MAQSIPAVYRAAPSAAGRPCEVIGWKFRRYILREVDKPLAGVWLASVDQVEPIGGTGITLTPAREVAK